MQDRNLLSDLYFERKNDFSKYALIFAGGVMAGYALKKFIDSPNFEKVKNNAADLVNDYFNKERKYIDIEVENVDDEE